MPNYQSISGIVTAYEDFRVGDAAALGCYKIMSITGGDDQITNFITSPYTFFVDGVMIMPGVRVTAFYDADAPVPLIYPPQYRAVVVARESRNTSVAVDFFDSDLVDSRGMLKLNIMPSTRVLLRNGQRFTQSPANHYLVAVYGATTRSIPAIARVSQAIVLCKQS